MSDMTPYGLIGAFWERMGGDSIFGGPEVPSIDQGFGGPVTPEMDLPQGRHGRVQYFQRGVICWTPDQGGECIAYVKRLAPGRGVRLGWGPTHPFTYDFWIVRWSFVPGVGTGSTDHQEDVFGQPNNSGTHDFQVPLPGEDVGTIGSDGYRYTFTGIVEGCDDPGDATCRQSWTPPLSIRCT